MSCVFCWYSALGAVALGGKVYICGGFDGASSLNSVETYDPETNEWTMISSMEKHRSASGVVVLDSQIYAIGGHDGLSIFDSVGFSLGITYNTYDLNTSTIIWSGAFSFAFTIQTE